jgi:Putative transposase of IS4/5 family (DUF4096)
MRYELNDYEWSIIRPMLPNKPRGIPRVDDRRILNGIFWVLRSGAPWRDLPHSYGPPTTCYNRFVRWRRAGIDAEFRQGPPYIGIKFGDRPSSNVRFPYGMRDVGQTPRRYVKRDVP